MTIELGEALHWARSRQHAALITIRADGRPQSSDISYFADGDTLVISLTDDRAKTRNLRRDPRAVMHLSDRQSWSYLSFDGTVELSAVTTAIDDETNDRLVAYYEAVSGKPHPDWPEYRAAMVAERRLLATFTPTSVVGQIH
jgi:PPOX class probable F420-dependent enzyme